MAMKMAKMWEVVESQHNKSSLNNLNCRARKRDIDVERDSLNGQQPWQIYNKQQSQHQ